MLRLALDHLKTKKMCKRTVKELPLLIKYVPERYRLNERVMKLF